MGIDETLRDKASRSWLIILVSVTLVLVVLATAVLFLLVINKFSIDIQLNGPEKLTIEYGQSYEEPGAAAQLVGSIVMKEGMDLEVRTDGTVPPLQLGEFPISYTAAWGPWSGTAVRTVVVMDSQPPVITLFTNTAYHTRPGQEYREEGYVAVDNYDGDITDRVEAIEGDGFVTYTVTDSSGNTATVIRQIRYADPE